MHIVKTSVGYWELNLFSNFLKICDLHGIKIDLYENTSLYLDNRLLYVFDENNEEVVAIMTHISLKYGSVENAYTDYKNSFLKLTDWVP